MPVVLTTPPVAMPWWTDDNLAELGRIAQVVDVDPEWIAAVMYSESVLRPDICYASNCTPTAARGLIQWLPSTLKSMYGLTTDQIAAFPSWGVTGQLPYLEKYLTWEIQAAGHHMNSAGAIYQGVFLPGSYANGSNPTSVVTSSPSAAYTANAGLDQNGDGTITVGDLEAHVTQVARGNANYQAFVKRLRLVTGAPPRKAWTYPRPVAPVAWGWGAVALTLSTAALVGVVSSWESHAKR